MTQRDVTVGLQGLGAAVQAGVPGVRIPVDCPVIKATVDQSDLIQNVTTQDLDDHIVVAREWIYAGCDVRFKEYVGKMVRRDVWVTIKHGLEMSGQQGG